MKENGEVLKTYFRVRLGDEIKEATEFVGPPFSVCMYGDENGGERLDVTLTRVCKDATGKIFLMVCKSDKKEKTPPACDGPTPVITVPLYCSCQ